MNCEKVIIVGNFDIQDDKQAQIIADDISSLTNGKEFILLSSPSADRSRAARVIAYRLGIGFKICIELSLFNENPCYMFGIIKSYMNEAETIVLVPDIYIKNLLDNFCEDLYGIGISSVSFLNCDEH
jgi:hypothetical protein